VNRLRISLASMSEEGVCVDAVVPAADLRPKGAESLPVDRVAVHGLLEATGGSYLFRGTVSGHFDVPCDRCLEPAQAPFDIEVAWEYEPGVPEPPVADDVQEEEDDDEDFEGGSTPAEDSGLYFFEGSEIDLAPQVWEEVVLAAPSKVLCSPECAGLCPQCGVNWNRTTCGCRVDNSLENKGLAGLADLFPNLKAKRPED